MKHVSSLLTKGAIQRSSICCWGNALAVTSQHPSCDIVPTANPQMKASTSRKDSAIGALGFPPALAQSVLFNQRAGEPIQRKKRPHSNGEQRRSMKELMHRLTLLIT